MAIISSGITTLTDLNDAIISGTQPVNPTVGTLWIDSSKSPAILKIFKNGAWVTQDLDLNSLDPDTAESIRNVVATIGNMSNDNLLDYKERQIIKDDLTDILGKVMLDTETALPTVAQLDVLTKGSFYSVRQNALNAGLEKTNSVYVETATQYQNLKTYLESLTPIKPWNVAVADKDKNVVVIKNTFRDKWLQYYLATEKLNLATTEKIKEAQEELDGKIDEVSLRDKTEILSGNPVFTDKSDDAVVHVGVDGKSEQNAGSGKNLANMKSTTVGNISGSDGSVLASSGHPLMGRTEFIPISIGSYSYALIDSTLTVEKYVLYNSSKAFISSTVLNNKTGTINISQSGFIKFAFTGNPENDLNNLVKTKFQVEEGTTATTYEPPAPSPDYPSAIKSLDKSFDIVSSVGKENLLKKTGWGAHSPYNTVPIVSGNTITFTKNNTGGYSAISQPALPFGSDIVYTLSGVAKINGKPVTNTTWGTHKIASTYQGGPPLKFELDDSTGKFVITQKWTANSAWLFHGHIFPANIGDVITIENFKIEKGTDNTPYNEHLSEISYDTQSPTLYKTNILLSEPLRSVGDVKDRVYLDSLDSLWKVERNIGEYTFTGNESWAGASTLGTVTRFWSSGLPFSNPIATTELKVKVKSGILNGFIYSTDFTTTEQEGISIKDGPGLSFIDFQIKLNTSRLSVPTGAGLNIWLKNNTLKIIYMLGTSTIETLSAEQQTKLNNIASFKGGNYVYTVANVTPNLNSRFKSNAWYRVNVLGEQLTYGNRNWARNGNFAYLLEDSAWSGYYKGTVREIVDISSDAPPFKNALHIKQTTSGVAGIIDAVIWEGAEANVLTGQSISMATWLKYQNVSNADLVMQVQVTGKKSDGTFVYDYPKVFSNTGTDMTWQRRTGTVKIQLFEGATEITRVMFRLGFAKAGTGEFWATGIQLETGTALGDWSPNPDDVQGDLDATKAQLILTEKEVALRVTKGNVVNEVNVDPTGVRIKGKKFTVDADTEFNANLTMNKGVIRSADGGTVLDLNNNTLSLDKPFSIGNTKSATTDDVGKAVDGIEIGATNLWVDTETTSGYNTSGSGGISSSTANHQVMQKVVGVTPNSNIIYQVWNPNKVINTTNSNRVSFFNANMTYISQVALPILSGEVYQTFSIKVPSTGYNARLGVIQGVASGTKDSSIKIKFEKGSKATDYTPSPEDVENAYQNLAIAKANLAEANAKAHADGKVTAEETRAINDAKAKLSQAQGYADTAVSNLEIGGRNLVPDTNKGKRGWGSTVANGATSFLDYDSLGVSAIKISTTVSSTSYHVISHSLNTGLFEKGQLYTLSLDIYSEVDISLNASIKEGNSTKTIIEFGSMLITRNKWTKVTLTSRTNAIFEVANQVLYLTGMNSVANYFIKNVKVEKGQKSTEWTPAIEDVQADIQDVSNTANSLKNFTDTAFSDGIIQRAEAQAISEHLNTLRKENDDLTNQYYSVYGNANLIGAPKTNLYNSKVSYNTAYTNLVNSINSAISGDKTTIAQKEDVNTKFTAYSNALKLLTQRLLESQTGVSEKIATDLAVAKANLAEVSAKAYADGKVTAEEKRAIADAENKLAEANNYSDEGNIYIRGTGNNRSGSRLMSVNGIQKYNTGGIGLRLVALRRTDLAVVHDDTYDVYNSDVRSTDLANALNALDDSVIVTLTSFDAIRTRVESLRVAMERVGGSGVLIGNSGEHRTPYALVGIPGIGKGAGIEVYTNELSTAPYAEISTKVINGTPQGINTVGTVLSADIAKAQAAIADMSSDSKITPVEKVQLKKEWATIASERASLDGLASNYEVTTERTNMTNAYNTLNTVLNGTGGILTSMSSTTTVVATTFRAQFDDYYEKKAILQRKVNELAKSIADSKTSPVQVESSILADKKIKDTRSTNQSPDWYFSNYSMQEIREFKQTATMGIGTGEGTYGVLTTNVPWNGNSGGSVKQSFVVGTKTYKRQGTTTSWTAWKDYDGTAELAETLAKNAGALAGTKTETYTSTPTIPYKAGDVWKNGTAVYISTATRSSGSFTSADWVLVGDVTSNNTAKDVTNVGGTSATTIRDRATNGNTAYSSTSLWKKAGYVTFDGGNIHADTITSGAIISDVGIINKLFASTANINTLTAKTAFINNIKAIDITADRIKTGILTGTNGDWNLNTGVMNFYNPSTADNLQLNQGEISFKNGTQGRYLRYQSEGLRLIPFASNTGTSKNTALHLIGGGNGSYQYIQFVSQETGGIDMRLQAVGQDMTAYHGSTGALIVAKYGEGSNSGLVISGAYETRHSTGVSLRIAGDSISTPRDGARNIYLTPQGIGAVVAGNAGGTRYNMAASDFVKQSTRDSKTDIKPIETKGLDVINRLTPVSYKKKDKVAQGIIETELGFISEDSLEVATTDGLGIYDSHITAYLVKAVQELDAGLKELKK